MPSSNKTTHLQLNKWLGSDKPKKDDFNGDNQKLDEACRLLQQSIELLDAAVKSGATANEQAHSALSTSLTNTITSHSGNSAIHVTQSEKTSWTSHSSNSAVHVTQTEKDTWTNKSGAILGSYVGDGKSTKKITLGYQPMFVLIFPVNDGLARANWSAQALALNGGCVSKLGSSLGMTLNSDGFTVEYYSSGGVDGYQIKHNASGVTYVYIAFKQ